LTIDEKWIWAQHLASRRDGVMKIGLNLQPQHRVFAGFAIEGLAFGGIYTRVSDIQTAMDVGQAAIGVALIGIAAGLMFSITVLSSHFEKFGFRKIILFAVPSMCLFSAVASLALNPVTMFFWLFLFGTAGAASNTVINVEADRTELLVGWRIMNRCHAIYSLGFLSTALIGAAARQLQITPFVHLLALGFALSVAVILAFGQFQPAPARAENQSAKAPLFAIPTAGVLLAGIFSLAGMIYEGAAADWGAIYMRDVFAVAPFIGGLALTLSSVSQAATRFCSDRLVDRLGPIKVAQIMLLVLGIGALAITFSSMWLFALIGFAFTGAGNAVIMPLAISAIAKRADRPAAINVAALTQFSWVAFFAGPPLIGMLAQHIHVRMTFGAALPLIALSFVLAPVVLREQPKKQTA
jgi:hypothetical protein